MENSSPQKRVNIRKLLDSFQLAGPCGTHIALVFEAAQMSLRDMKSVFRPDGFDEDFVRGAIFELLKILDFLHTYGATVHTGIILQSCNLCCDSSDVSQTCIQAICYWEHTTTIYSRSLKKRNARLPYLGSRTHPGETSTCHD